VVTFFKPEPGGEDIMKLTDEEKGLLQGSQGPARQKAMELLVRYGEALGAERMVETNNVISAINAPYRAPAAGPEVSVEAAFSEFNLDSDQPLEIPRVKAYSCRVITGFESEDWRVMGFSDEAVGVNRKVEAFCGRIGMHMMNTCAPYLVGNVPVRGEHCAWMESSAVVYCNSVLGGRTNTEGTESSGAAMLVGRTPYWGYHIDENRLGTHLIEVECQPESVMDWGLLGYYAGETVGESVPVFDGVAQAPNIARLKHCGAAAASSGGVELYHVVGFTPEAGTLREALGGRRPAKLRFGPAERKQTYDNLNSATDENVDFVMMGCPHYTIEEVWNACRLIEGRHVREGLSLWIFTPRALKSIADKQGLTKIISEAGGHLMSDTCPCISMMFPKGARTAATDSGKHAHYMPAMLNLPTWFGSQKDCIDAAVSGKWKGELK
jgi:predicted aconitase